MSGALCAASEGNAILASNDHRFIGKIWQNTSFKNLLL